ncbi:MFS transporter [Streptomyces sp. NPDC021115]
MRNAASQAPAPAVGRGCARSSAPGRATREWYDWNVYALFAPFVAEQFFDPEDSFSGLLATLAVFAVGFVMRPLGGLLFGWFGDRHGRRAALMLSIVLGAVVRHALPDVSRHS